MNATFLLFVPLMKDSVLLEKDPLTQIQQFTETTAVNTTFEFWWDGFNILIAVIALVFSIVTFFSQKNTSDNTKKLSQNAQRNLLLDLVRHLYRNLVITYTIKTKLEELDFKGYPSEEHLLKLKIPMENIHLEAFYGNDKRYEVMHNLYLNLRNYNEEIDIACQHFKSNTLLPETKKRDLNTLLLKPHFLTKRILTTIYELWEKKSISDDFNTKQYDDKIADLLVGSQTLLAVKNKILEAQSGKTNAANNQVNVSDANFEPYSNKESSYAKILFLGDEWDDFVEALKRDVVIERGKNNEGGDKVYIIPFA